MTDWRTQLENAVAWALYDDSATIGLPLAQVTCERLAAAVVEALGIEQVDARRAYLSDTPVFRLCGVQEPEAPAG